EQERERQETRRVREDVPRRGLVATHNRQHRDSGALVVVANEKRECPEVGGRPEEDDREQEPGREIERARDRGPADEWRDQARGAAARRRAADERGGEQPERRNAALREEHPAKRGQEKQRHDRGLRQRDEIADQGALARRGSPRDRGEPYDAAPQETRHRGMRAQRPRREL